MDSDPNRDGVQVVVDIDLMASDLMEGDLNAYRKFVSQEAIDSAANTGFELYDLDGNPILQKGWYDFISVLTIMESTLGMVHVLLLRTLMEFPDHQNSFNAYR